MTDRNEQVEIRGEGIFDLNFVGEDAEYGDAAKEEGECPACGQSVGELHIAGCDMELCPNCSEQYFVCDCVTWEKAEMWGV